MTDFIGIRWDPEFLEKYGLPDVGSPVPEEVCKQAAGPGAEFDFVLTLYWLQEHSAQLEKGWERLEPPGSLFLD